MKKSVIEIALGEYAIKEHSGSNHNKEVVKYFQECGFDIDDDETSWCSAFANWVLKQAGIKGSNNLAARSWMKVGTETTTPKLGDITVFWRESPSSWKGHVAFYVNEDKENIYVLGGNQSNKVCISAYPKARLLGHRSITAL